MDNCRHSPTLIGAIHAYNEWIDRSLPRPGTRSERIEEGDIQAHSEMIWQCAHELEGYDGKPLEIYALMCFTIHPYRVTFQFCVDGFVAEHGTDHSRIREAYNEFVREHPPVHKVKGE